MRRTARRLVAAAAVVLATAACTSTSGGGSSEAALTADAEMQFASAFVLRGLSPESTLEDARKADTGVKSARVVDMAIATVPDDVGAAGATGSPSASASGTGGTTAALIGEAGLIACVVVGLADDATAGTVPSWALAVTNSEMYYWVPAADCRELATIARSAPTPTGSDGSPQVGRAGLPPNALDVTDDAFTRVALRVPQDQLTEGGAELVAMIRDLSASQSASPPAATTNVPTTGATS